MWGSLEVSRASGMGKCQEAWVAGGMGVRVVLTAKELILGCHCALHDLWLDEPSAETICI